MTIERILSWIIKVAYAQPAPAQTPAPSGPGVAGSQKGVTLPSFLPSGSTLVDILDKIFSVLFKISIPIVAIMVVIGGIQIMTAGGSSEKVTAGRKTIQYAVIGFIIVLLGSSVVPVIRSIF